MIRHLMIMIWNQRRSNVWLFLELALVVCLLWGLLDSFLVDEYTYRRPLGMDIERVYRINLGRVAESSPAFLPDSLRGTDGRGRFASSLGVGGASAGGRGHVRVGLWLPIPLS